MKGLLCGFFHLRHAPSTLFLQWSVAAALCGRTVENQYCHTVTNCHTRARKLQTKLIDRLLLSRHCSLLLSCHRKLLLRTAIRLHGAVLQENVVQRESKRLQRLLPDPLLQLTLPKGDAMPAHGRQLMLHPFISRPVALKFSETLYVRIHPYT